MVSEEMADAVIPYKLRDEQAEAVQRTMDYFGGRENAEFLWNAKPRFGKTLSAYDLRMKLGAQNILIVTNRPAILVVPRKYYHKFDRKCNLIFHSPKAIAPPMMIKQYPHPATYRISGADRT